MTWGIYKIIQMREQSLFPNVNQGITFIYFLRWTQCASKNGHNQGIPWWHSGLRIQPCHCCSSYHCCGTGLIPSLGTSTCHRCSQKKKKKMNITMVISEKQTRELCSFATHHWTSLLSSFVIWMNIYAKLFLNQVHLLNQKRCTHLKTEYKNNLFTYPPDPTGNIC